MTSRKVLLGLLIFIAIGKPLFAQQPTAEAEKHIRQVLHEQQKAWNAGDLEAFMVGYWKSDSLQFIGKNIRHGWQATLDGYKKGYPDKAAMGELRFDIWQTVRLADDAYLVSGKYTLIREKDQPSGPFTLIFRLKAGKWVIVYDHTSG